MVKIVTINRGCSKQEEKEKVKVYYEKVRDQWEVITIPQNTLLEDSVADMLDDINQWDFDYLKEVLGDNYTFSVTSL